MKAGELGEKRLVEMFVRNLFGSNMVTVPAGLDDTAAVAHGSEELVLKTDVMFSSTHFPPAMGFKAMGRKVAVANLSDIAAMGARPLALLVAFGVPPEMDSEDLEKVFFGINEACEEHRCPFVGGDTKKAKELTLAGMAVGACKKEELLLRSNAKVGDVVAVTGTVGGAACGMQILTKSLKFPSKLSAPLVEAFTHPTARIAEGRAIASSAPGSAGMDITDGLFYTVSELAKASKAGIRIHEGKLPFTKEVKEFARLQLKAAPVRLLEYGEDYELVVCIRKEKFAKAKEAVETAGGSLTEIGDVIKEKRVFLGSEPVDIHGYDVILR